MKRIIIIGSLISCALLAPTGEVRAQSGIEQVLKNIETNNKAVSYTHLDVYKRQSLRHLRIPRKEENGLVAGTGKEIINNKKT